MKTETETAEARSNMATPVYSYLPPNMRPGDFDDRLRDKVWKAQRMKAPKLPWTLEDLDGTLWMNVHVCGLEEVVIKAGRKGQPILVDVSEGLDFDHFDIGLWCEDRYVIEHWARVDHLPIEGQKEWYEHGVKMARARLNKAERFYQKMKGDDPSTYSCYAANLNIRKSNVKRAGEELKHHIEELREFNRKHGSTTTFRDINEGVEGQTVLWRG